MDDLNCRHTNIKNDSLLNLKVEQVDESNDFKLLNVKVPIHKLAVDITNSPSKVCYEIAFSQLAFGNHWQKCVYKIQQVLEFPILRR